MVYLKVKENTAQARIFLEFIKTMPFVEFVEKNDIPNAETIKAIEDARKGKGTKAKSVKDLMKKLNE